MFAVLEEEAHQDFNIPTADLMPQTAISAAKSTDTQYNWRQTPTVVLFKAVAEEPFQRSKNAQRIGAFREPTTATKWGGPRFPAEPAAGRGMQQGAHTDRYQSPAPFSAAFRAPTAALRASEATGGLQPPGLTCCPPQPRIPQVGARGFEGRMRNARRVVAPGSHGNCLDGQQAWNVLDIARSISIFIEHKQFNKHMPGLLLRGLRTVLAQGDVATLWLVVGSCKAWLGSEAAAQHWKVSPVEMENLEETIKAASVACGRVEKK